jgi:hypothetical protein
MLGGAVMSKRTVTTVTCRDLSRLDLDHSGVTNVTPPYRVSRFVTLVCDLVPMSHFLENVGADDGAYAFALCKNFIQPALGAVDVHLV